MPQAWSASSFAGRHQTQSPTRRSAKRPRAKGPPTCNCCQNLEVFPGTFSSTHWRLPFCWSKSRYVTDLKATCVRDLSRRPLRIERVSDAVKAPFVRHSHPAFFVQGCIRPQAGRSRSCAGRVELAQRRSCTSRRWAYCEAVQRWASKEEAVRAERRTMAFSCISTWREVWCQMTRSARRDRPRRSLLAQSSAFWFRDRQVAAWRGYFGVQPGFFPWLGTQVSCQVIPPLRAAAPARWASAAKVQYLLVPGQQIAFIADSQSTRMVTCRGGWAESSKASRTPRMASISIRNGVWSSLESAPAISR